MVKVRVWQRERKLRYQLRVWAAGTRKVVTLLQLLSRLVSLLWLSVRLMLTELSFTTDKGKIAANGSEAATPLQYSYVLSSKLH